MNHCTRYTKTCSRTGAVGSAPQLVLRKLQKDGDLVEMGKQLSWMNARRKRLDFNCVMAMDVSEIVQKTELKIPSVTSFTLNIDSESVEVPDNGRLLERTIRKGRTLILIFCPLERKNKKKRKEMKESRNLHPLMNPCTRDTRACSRTGPWICSAISSPETAERWGFGGNGKAIKLDECEREKFGF
ncbi:hypothetical protein CEXT_754321 [Caerostris extrusa]|uniref:Uncharacterized protein n=1 Tax=Caerostris extrusa TaxID=172846 RepID=A0AAV4XM06_CAEEX|nr:hypothetical protein CEXT_754321 [Caerostris extrusa]